MKHPKLGRWISDSLKASPLRTNSLIITLYGDAIAPHGSSVWLGNLIDLVSPMGISARAVRTSIFRLAQEAWLHATPVGRRSAYGLTAAGLRRINHAYRRIYDTPHSNWKGEWQIVIVPEGALAANDRETLRHDLLWSGYGAIAPGVFAHPFGDTDFVRDALRHIAGGDKVLLLNASTPDGANANPLHSMVHQCWRLDRLAEDYRRFISRFRPVLKWLTTGKTNDSEQCFILRTLLIHEFRRVQLRDPQLPDSLLDRRWLGHAARELCRDIYEKTLSPSEQHLMATLQTPEGALPAADGRLFERFGGLAID
jgi:phenylacetic acid degradation operon negative regulatory protein